MVTSRRRLLIGALGAALSGRALATRHGTAEFLDFIPPDIRASVRNGTNEQPLQTYMQAALDSGAALIRGSRGLAFRVHRAGQLTLGKMKIPFCLALPEGVEVDLQGATVELGRGQNAAIFMNAAGRSCTGAILSNGVLDGRRREQDQSTLEVELGCIVLHSAVGVTVRNLAVREARQYAGRFLNCTRCTFDGLTAVGSDGDGWSFGIDASSQQVRACSIDKVAATDCKGIYPGLAGNPAIFTVDDCRVGSVVASNCAGGIKIQDSSRKSTFARLEFKGGGLGTANSGIKVQGSPSTALIPRDIFIGEAAASDCAGEGLAVRFAERVTIGSFAGRANSNLLANRDIDLRGESIHIRRLESVDSHGAGVTINAPGSYLLDDIVVVNAARRAVHIAADSSVEINRCTVTNRISGKSIIAVEVTATKATGRIKELAVVSPASSDRQFVTRSPGFIACAFEINRRPVRSETGQSC